MVGSWLSCKRLDIGTWGIVSRNGAEGIRFAEKQRAELGLANPRRILEYGLEYRLKLTGELEITFSTSELAACCSSASFSLCSSSAILFAVSTPEDLRGRAIFAVVGRPTFRRLRVFAALPTGLLRRLITSPEAQDSPS